MSSRTSVHGWGACFDVGTSQYGPSVEPRDLLERLNEGSLQNVRFRDLRRLVEEFGFELKRTSGSHRIHTPAYP